MIRHVTQSTDNNYYGYEINLSNDLSHDETYVFYVSSQSCCCEVVDAYLMYKYVPMIFPNDIILIIKSFMNEYTITEDNKIINKLYNRHTIKNISKTIGTCHELSRGCGNGGGCEGSVVEYTIGLSNSEEFIIHLGNCHNGYYAHSTNVRYKVNDLWIEESDVI